MRRCTLLLFVAVFVAVAPVRADEADDKAKALLAKQKKTAEANWMLLEIGDFAHQETDHFLIYTSKAMEKNLKDHGTLLENQYKQAVETLKFPEKKEPWKGKLAVYLFVERVHFTSFVRRVEKRRVVSGEVSSYVSNDEAPHVACSPPQNKWEWPVEAQAAEQIGAVLLQRRVEARTVLPEWLVTGFGRASYYRMMPKDALTLADRRLAGDIVARKKTTARDIWTGPLEADEAGALSGALADFFTYGPGAVRFEKLLDGFKPAENVEKKTMEQAIDAAGMKVDLIEKAWKPWVAAPK